MAYSNVKIAIPNVTGNIVITATATPSVTPIINLVDTYGIAGNTRISGSSGNNTSQNGFATVGDAPSNAIPVSSGDIIRVTGQNVSLPASEGLPWFSMYNDDGTYTHKGTSIYIGKDNADSAVTSITNGFQIEVKEYLPTQGTKFRISFECTDTSDVIVTKNQEM